MGCLSRCFARLLVVKVDCTHHEREQMTGMKLLIRDQLLQSLRDDGQFHGVTTRDANNPWVCFMVDTVDGRTLSVTAASSGQGGVYAEIQFSSGSIVQYHSQREFNDAVIAFNQGIPDEDF